MQQTFHLVVGLGQTGMSIARYLARRNVPFVVYDTRLNPEGSAEFQFNFPGIELFLGELPEDIYDKLSGIICSPGVPLEAPFIQKAMQLNIPVLGDIDCLVREVKTPIIAITGTNGKSTVTTLVGEMAKDSGLNVAVAGNIGLPVLDMLDVGANYDLWVLELSSFQLDLTHSLAAKAAVILNISPDHLDRHKRFEAYVASKHKIYQNADVIVCNRDDSLTFPSSETKPKFGPISYGLDEPTAGNWGLIKDSNKTYLAKGSELLLSVDELKIRGQHNWMNALAACALADSFGINKTHMKAVLRRFAGLPHRCQWVRTLEGVDWVNDSKATNVGAALSAITGIGGSMQGKIVLIAGGLGKGADFSDLASPMAEYVRTVVLMGQDADLIEAVVPNGVEVVRAGTMDDAVQKAQSLASPGDVVLMSPACASFDMFRDFNHRGDDFIAAVNAL